MRSHDRWLIGSRRVGPIGHYQLMGIPLLAAAASAILALSACSQPTQGHAAAPKSTTSIAVTTRVAAPDPVTAEADFLARVPLEVVPIPSDRSLQLAAISTAKNVCAKLDNGVDPKAIGKIFFDRYGMVPGMTFIALAEKNYCPWHLP